MKLESLAIVFIGCFLIGILIRMTWHSFQKESFLKKADYACQPYKAYNFVHVNDKIYAVCASNNQHPVLVEIK